MRFNHVQYQRIIHLRHRCETSHNHITSELHRRDTWRSKHTKHRATRAQSSSSSTGVSTWLNRRLLNQPHVVFSSSPAGVKLMTGGSFYTAPAHDSFFNEITHAYLQRRGLYLQSVRSVRCSLFKALLRPRSLHTDEMIMCHQRERMRSLNTSKSDMADVNFWFWPYVQRPWEWSENQL